MAANDYCICTALFHAYIAKPSKVRPNTMTNDRRIITEEEILRLVDWYLADKLQRESPESQGIWFESGICEGKRIVIKFEDANEETKE